MAITAQFVATPKVGQVLLSVANTARDGTGALGTVLTAGSSGSRVERIALNATGTTTAGMVRLYVHNGTAAFLLLEIPVAPITPSATVQSFSSTYVFDGGLMLPVGYSLRASTHNAESFHVTAIGGDF